MNASFKEIDQSHAFKTLGLDRAEVLKTLDTFLRLTALGNTRFQDEYGALARAGNSHPQWLGLNLDNLVKRAAVASQEWRDGFVSANTTLHDVATRRMDDPHSFSILGKHPAAVIKANDNLLWTQKPLFKLDANDVVAIGASKVTPHSPRFVAWEPVAAIMSVVAIHHTLYPELRLNAAAADRVAEIKQAAPVLETPVDMKKAVKIFGDRDLDKRIMRLAHRPDFKELVRQAVEKIEKKLG